MRQTLSKRAAVHRSATVAVDEAVVEVVTAMVTTEVVAAVTVTPTTTTLMMLLEARAGGRTMKTRTERTAAVMERGIRAMETAEMQCPVLLTTGTTMTFKTSTALTMRPVPCHKAAVWSVAACAITAS